MYLEKNLEVIQHPCFESAQLKSEKSNLNPSVEQLPSLGIIIQARMNSSRLPGKVGMVVGHQEYLAHQIDRVLQKCPRNRCVIATTKGREDDLIFEIALEAGVGCYRGNSEDVLNRYIEAGEHYDFKDVVRLTGDCPLIDPYIMDSVIGVYCNCISEKKYVSNTLVRTFPRGFDVEVTSLKNLKESWGLSNSQYNREHVTPFIASGGILECVRINCPAREDLSRWRFTLDAVEDHLQLSRILMGVKSYEFNEVLRFSTEKNLLKFKKESA